MRPNAVVNRFDVEGQMFLAAVALRTFRALESLRIFVGIPEMAL